MTTKHTDPGRKIALTALSGSSVFPGEMLEEVIREAFDQLCWHRTTPQLEAFVESLRDIMSEDGGEHDFAPIHASDCALHNEPALPAGPCDCGVDSAPTPDQPA